MHAKHRCARSGETQPANQADALPRPLDAVVGRPERTCPRILEDRIKCSRRRRSPFAGPHGDQHGHGAPLVAARGAGLDVGGTGGGGGGGGRRCPRAERLPLLQARVPPDTQPGHKAASVRHVHSTQQVESDCRGLQGRLRKTGLFKLLVGGCAWEVGCLVTTTPEVNALRSILRTS